MSKGSLKERSYAFALPMVKLYRFIVGRNKEYVLSKQVLRLGTPIGANVEEAGQAQSKGDIVHKLAIAQKEAFETAYWLRLLHDSENLSAAGAGRCYRIALKMVTASSKTAKRNA